jgi:hypothetical protein
VDSEDYREIDSLSDSVVRQAGGREIAAFAKRRQADLRKLVKESLNKRGEYHDEDHYDWYHESVRWERLHNAGRASCVVQALSRFGASVLWLFRWTEPEHWSANFFSTVGLRVDSVAHILPEALDVCYFAVEGDGQQAAANTGSVEGRRISLSDRGGLGMWHVELIFSTDVDLWLTPVDRPAHDESTSRYGIPSEWQGEDLYRLQSGRAE